MRLWRPNDPQAARKEKRSYPRHPWIQLLDLEHHQQKPVLPKNPEGKPPRRFPRDKKMLIAMTSTESEALDTLVALFKKRIRANVVRADVIAFMASPDQRDSVLEPLGR